MARFAFRAGQHIRIGVAEYVLDRLLRDRTWQLENIATGEYSKRPLDELLKLYCDSSLTFLTSTSSDYNMGDGARGVLQPTLSDFSDKQAARAIRYAAYMRALDASLESASSDRDLKSLIDRVAKEINDPEPPSTKTIRRVRLKWVESGGDILSLVPNYKARGHHNKLSQALEWLIKASLNCTYLTDMKKKITVARENLIAKLTAINSDNPDLMEERFTKTELASTELEQLRFQAKELGPIEPPSVWTLYRRRNELTHYEILVAQMGKQYADTEYRISFPAAKSPRPLERVDGDETRTDLFVIDEVRQLLLGRAYGVCLYDAYCHGVAGAYIGFEPQSQLSYFNAIRHQILPKTYIASVYPAIKGRWDIHGVAESYNLDNAMAVHGKDFEEVARELNTTILFDPPKTPWYKGLIERFFRELNEDLLQQQTGTCFGNFAELGGEYDPTKNAIIPYSLLLLMFHKWVVEIHLQSPNRGINNQTPAGLWERYQDELPPPLPPHADKLDIILGRRSEKPIFHYGIEIDHLLYQSQELGALRKRLSRRDLKHPIVTAKSPAGNLEYIYVFDPQSKTYFSVPAAHQEYARGLTAWAHKVHVQHCRNNKKAVDIHALSESQAEIWSMCLAAAKLNKTVARYMEDHARPHPTGSLASYEMVTNMVNKLAGRSDAPVPPPHQPRKNLSAPKTFTDPGAEQLPEFQTITDLPELSSGNTIRRRT